MCMFIKAQNISQRIYRKLVVANGSVPGGRGMEGQNPTCDCVFELIMHMFYLFNHNANW